MKGIWISAIVVAFVAGTIVTGAAVFADDFIFPQPYINTGTDQADSAEFMGDNARVNVGCDEGDTFVSGSAHGIVREGATPLNILINEPRDTAHATGGPDGSTGHIGSIDWHATARNPDSSGTITLTVNVICLDTNNDDETDSIDSTDEDSNSDGSDDTADGTAD